MKIIELHTDGACSGNPGPGAWCYILKFKEIEKISSGFVNYTTNNKMELISVIEGLKALKENCEVNLYSDSQYVVKAINDWLQGWVKTNFKGKANEELWRAYLEVSKNHKINAIWVKGHNGDIMNERCNKIAQSLCKTNKI